MCRSRAPYGSGLTLETCPRVCHSFNGGSGQALESGEGECVDGADEVTRGGGGGHFPSLNHALAVSLHEAQGAVCLDRSQAEHVQSLVPLSVSLPSFPLLDSSVSDLAPDPQPGYRAARSHLHCARKLAAAV